MLALRTGWTDRTIADRISDDFRRACHHALYAETLAPDLAAAREVLGRVDALDITEVPTAKRADLWAVQDLATKQVAALRTLLRLEGDG